jgi:hypothetical protein
MDDINLFFGFCDCFAHASPVGILYHNAVQ